MEPSIFGLGQSIVSFRYISMRIVEKTFPLKTCVSNNKTAKLVKVEQSIFGFGLVCCHFWGYQNEIGKLSNQLYRAWPDCMDVKVGLAVLLVEEPYCNWHLCCNVWSYDC